MLFRSVLAQGDMKQLWKRQSLVCLLYTSMQHSDLSTLFITHDIDEAILLSDRIYILNGTPGTIREEIVIREKKPRAGDFALSEAFLEYKRRIISKL